MSHLRWNPLLGTYTMVAANRQNRPHLPAGQCPFCPGSGQVPNDYEVLVYPNDFPALSSAYGEPEAINSQVYHAARAAGACEVILYSPDHYKGLAQLPQAHVLKLVQTWAQRYVEHSKNPEVQYIFPFENRGEEVGVTIHHPHGQLYAYPFVPLKIQTELNNALDYYQQHGRHLLQVMFEEERADGRRVVFENDHFTAFIPWFNDYPYGVYIMSRQYHRLQDMNESAQVQLAEALQNVIGGFDTIFNRPFPYMMGLYQAPVNSKEYQAMEEHYPFHIKFYPPLRAADRIKWNASSETAAWAAANTLLVEETAPLLKQAIETWKAEQ